MQINLLAFAVPLFTGFMLLEFYYSRKKEKKVFHFEEAVANLNIGIAERVTDLFTTGLFYFFFAWVYKNFAICHITPNFFTWLALFIATDFVWYWYHRFGHEINLFWSAHVVHHQSNDFNYTASVRITVFQSVARCIFWSILPVLGFPPQMITLFLLIHGAYPFFTHTQMIGRLGFLEKIFVTPTHHGVHHSSNPEYLDKNYGDILIIWDKIFGTYAEEKAKPEYGLTAPLHSYSFLWQNFHFMLELSVSVKRARGLKNKLRVLLGRPDDIDPRIRQYLEKKFRIHKQVHTTSVLNNYISIQTLVTLVLLFFFILFEHYYSNVQLITGALFILISVINTGALLEQRRWIFYLEYIRLVLICFFIISFYPAPLTVQISILVLAGVLCYYKTLSNRYYNYFYNYSPQ